MGHSVPPLVTTSWLSAHLGSPGLVVIEVDEEAGRYWSGHVPGAHNLDWIDDLHEPLGRTFLRSDGFEALMDRLAIAEDDHVVLYGDAMNAFAASAFWLFRYYGHRTVSLLDGGRRLWLLEDRELHDADPPPVQRPAPYQVAGVDTDLRVTRDELLTRFVGAPDGTAVIDCRTFAEYAGWAVGPSHVPLEREHSLGHVPGAVCLPCAELIDPCTERLLPPDQLRRVVVEHGIRADAEIVVYCSVAERSALIWFALHEVLGVPHVRNYDGGWAEYGSLMGVPIAR